MDLHGVVLAGGKSRRMGRDKALLSYDGRTSQLERACALLRRHCSTVEVSCRPDQEEAWASSFALKFRPDRYPPCGPLAGILTALETHPGRAILAIACDLPFLNDETLTRLVGSRSTTHWATAFVHGDGFLEPLCAIYEPRAGQELHAYMKATGRLSPQEALRRHGVARLPLADPEVLANMNHPFEYTDALARLKARGD